MTPSSIALEKLMTTLSPLHPLLLGPREQVRACGGVVGPVLHLYEALEVRSILLHLEACCLTLYFLIDRNLMPNFGLSQVCGAT